MKAFNAKKLFVVLVLINLISLAQNSRTTVIDGDVVTSNTEYPWAVQLLSGDKISCSGVLIGDRWVLTAGHCIGVYNATNYSVLVGSRLVINKSSSYQKVDVLRGVVHEGYRDGGDVDDDLALLELEHPVTLSASVKPITFLDATDNAILFKDGTPCVYTGWGRSNNDVSTSDTLRKATFQTLDTANSIVRQILPTNVYHKNVVVVPSEKNNKICGGDSGGPLIWMDKSSTPRLIGIASRTVEFPFQFNCEGGTAIFTNPNYYKDWINAVMNTPGDYVPQLVDIGINDTISTCGGKLSPTIQFYNLGRVSIDKLYLKITLTTGLQSQEITKTLNLADNIYSNWTSPVYLKKFNVELDVQEGKEYQVRMELLNADGSSIQHPLVTPITKHFFVQQAQRQLYLSYEYNGNQLPVRYFTFGLQPFNTEQQVLSSIQDDHENSFWKIYYQSDFEITTTATGKRFLLRDTFCVQEACFTVSGSLKKNVLLYQNASDTLFYQPSMNHDGPLYNFCMRSASCALKNRTHSFIDNNWNICAGQSVKMFPYQLANPDNYNFHWYHSESDTAIGTNDTLITNRMLTHYLLIEDPSVPACKSIAYEGLIYSNTSIPYIYLNDNKLYAHVRDQQAFPVWYHNGIRLESTARMLDAPEAGEYYIRYYSIKQPSLDTCWSRWESNKIDYSFQVGIESPTTIQHSFRISPIPAQDELHIDNPEYLSIASISVIDLQGRVLMKRTIQDSTSDRTSLVVRNLTSGCYVLRIESEKGVYTTLINIM